MVTSPSNLQDQQSTGRLLDISMVDAFHEETVTNANAFKAKNIQLDSTGTKNEVQPNAQAILVSQSMLANTTINRHGNEVDQLNSTGMLGEYGHRGLFMKEE
jgi:hypothetical protein